MKKFSLHLSQYVPNNTTIPVYDLHINGKCKFDKFYKEIQKSGNLKGELAGAINHLISSANLMRLPKTKINTIQHRKLPYKLYEAKKNNIRVYFIHEEHTGRIIITGGLKKDQDADINSIVHLLQEYYNGK